MPKQRRRSAEHVVAASLLPLPSYRARCHRACAAHSRCRRQPPGCAACASQDPRPSQHSKYRGRHFERLRRSLEQFAQVGILGVRFPFSVKNRLGYAFDQFFRGTDREGGIMLDLILDATDFVVDARGVHSDEFARDVTHSGNAAFPKPSVFVDVAILLNPRNKIA